MRRIKISGDGRPITTKITDVDTGQELTGILTVRWMMNAASLKGAWITEIMKDAEGKVVFDDETGKIGQTREEQVEIAAVNLVGAIVI